MKNIVILRFNLPALSIPLNEVESIQPHSDYLTEIILKSGKRYLSYYTSFE